MKDPAKVYGGTGWWEELAPIDREVWERMLSGKCNLPALVFGPLGAVVQPQKLDGVGRSASVRRHRQLSD